MVNEPNSPEAAMSPEQQEAFEVRSRTALLCPRNDHESNVILKLAEKAGISIIQSSQEHGARLDQEPNLEQQLLELKKPDLWIVEIPGPDQEKVLAGKGLNVKVIDHHVYGELDRLEDPITAEAKPSSLEQFLGLAKIKDEELSAWGFDPKVIRGVGIMDARYAQGLREAGYTKEDIRNVMDFKHQLSIEHNPEYKKLLALAEQDWNAGRSENGFWIIESPHDGKIRRVISEVSIAHEMDTAPMIIATDGGKKISVQNVNPEVVTKLMKNVPGHTYAFASGTAFGIRNEDGKYTVRDILKALKE